MAGLNLAIEPGFATFLAADGYPLSYLVVPATPVADHSSPVVVYLHGIQSHAGWYHGSIAEFCAAGATVYFLERRGSGQTSLERGHARGPLQLVDDTRRFLTAVRHQHPGQQVILVSVSWGGKVAAVTAGWHPDLVDRVAFVCPGWFPKVSPAKRDTLKIAWSGIVHPKRLFEIPLNDPELFTANPDRQRYIVDDVLSLRWASARLLVTSRMFELLLPRVARRLTMPMLLMLAGRDRIIDNVKTRDFFSRLPAADRCLIEYPDGHHTLEFEESPRKFWMDLVEWTVRRDPSKSLS